MSVSASQVAFAVYIAATGIFTVIFVPSFASDERWKAALFGLCWPIFVVMWLVEATTSKGKDR